LDLLLLVSLRDINLSIVNKEGELEGEPSCHGSLLRILGSWVALGHFESYDFTLTDSDNPKLAICGRETNLKVDNWGPLITAEAKTSEDTFAIEGEKLTLFTEANPYQIRIS
jgi:hypothetical protein